MEAKHLMIGNWINPENPTCVVADFHDHERDPFSIVTFEPILLTEKWLLKFGFVSNENYDEPTYEIEVKTGMRDKLILSIQPETLDSRISTGLLIVGEDGMDKWVLPKEPWKYVHQLQNLFFALTGQELILK